MPFFHKHQQSHRREEPNSILTEPSSTCPSNQQAEEWAGTATAHVNKSAGVNEPGKVDGGGYHNPDPWVRLIGPANEGQVIMDDQECMALIDSGAMMSMIAISHVQKMGLKIHSLQKIVKIEGSGGGKVPYMGYVEVHLDLTQFAAFHEDILMLVIDHSLCTKRMPVAIGTLHID